MLINWITIRVRDFERSKAFYGDYLGLKPTREFAPSPDMRIAFFAADNGMQVELICDNTAPADSTTGVSIGLTTDSYAQLLDTARQNHILTAEPTLIGGHMECFFVTDPNGVGVQIIKP